MTFGDAAVGGYSRSPHGERGLKYQRVQEGGRGACRSPHGERGLKFKTLLDENKARGSLSSRRAWIEIVLNAHICSARLRVALLTESVD